MKKLVLFLMVALFTTSGLFAQQRQRATPEERAKRQTEALVKELGLTTEQKDKVYEINLKYAQPRTNTANTDREKRREEFQKLQKEKDDAIKAVLTDEQKVKYEKYQKDLQEKMKEGRRQRDN